MSYSRLPYDSCAYNHQLLESTGPGTYMLDPNNMCDPCFVPDPSVNVQRSGAAICPKNLIDVDSELLGITRRQSKCPGQKYLPSDQPFCNAVPLKECNELRAEFSRLVNPPCTLKCSGVNRWESLCQQPQDQVEIPFEWRVSSRIVTKDTFRPCTPKPLSQTLALPSGGAQEPPMFCGVEREVHPLNFRSCNEIKHY
jgi:hypothetical protein